MSPSDIGPTIARHVGRESININDFDRAIESGKVAYIYSRTDFTDIFGTHHFEDVAMKLALMENLHGGPGSEARTVYLPIKRYKVVRESES